MESILEKIDRMFPIRRSDKQKEAFRAYVMEQFPDARLKESDGHKNILLYGEPEKAKVIFCAHYDTPRHSVFPNLMLPANRGLHTLYGILIMLPLFMVVALFLIILTSLPDARLTLSTRALLLACYFFIYFGLFLLLFRGPENKHNRNDNTSGTAAVMELAETMNGNSECAFLLFDNEEKGKLGSKAFAKSFPEVKAGVPVINLDCVGNGSTFVLSASSGFLASPLCEQIRSAAKKNDLSLQILDRAHSKMNSDHVNFDISAGICACLKSRRGILYTPRIHTNQDTVADEKMIHALVKTLSDACDSL